MHTRIEVSRSAIHNSVRIFRELSPGSKFMAVVKSNAYGHGLSEVVSILGESVDYFGVNSLSEAFQVVRLAPKNKVLVMGRGDEAEYRTLGQLVQDNPETGLNIEVALSSIPDLQMLSRLSPRTSFHLKADTGMSRLGLSEPGIDEVLEYLEMQPDLPWTGLMSHFANVEDVTEQSYARLQLERFQKMRERAEAAAGNRNLLAHMAASAPALIMPESRLDMIRVGISLYGLWPSPETRISFAALRSELPLLSPAMRWVTRIVLLNQVKQGAFIGYGCTYQAQSDMTLAVLPVGYFEGYERGFSNSAYVLVRGRRAPLVGRVCMNMIMVDVSHIPQVKVGDDAVLIGQDGGESITADDLASLTNTINYEVVTRIQQDLPRVIVD